MTDTPPIDLSQYVTFTSLEGLLTRIDAIVNTHEEQLSYLLLMASEMFVGLEAIIDEVFADKTPEEIKTFRTKIVKNSTEFLAALQKAMKSGGVDGRGETGDDDTDVVPSAEPSVEHVDDDDDTGGS